jgi:hypothetical protein
MIALEQIQAFAKYAKEFAPGIPAKREIEKLPVVKRPQNWTMALQRHRAERAGEHLDLRLVDPKGKAHSWALPQAKIPKPGEQAVWALPQPTHTADYALKAGKKKPFVIAEGYGKGVVNMERQAPADVYHVDEDHPTTKVRFNLYPSTGPEEYAIVKTRENKEILVNKTMHRRRLKHLPLGQKPKLKAQTSGSVDVQDRSEVMMPKYDGAHTILDLKDPGRISRVFSYRTPKKRTSGVIEHTHKVPVLLKKRVPKELAGTVLRTELIGVDKGTGQAIPGTEVGGYLNASVATSRKKQKDRGVRLTPVAFDVEKFRGKDVGDLPLEQRMSMLREVKKGMGIPITEIARTAKEKGRMLANIRAGKHKMTGEGVILKPLQPGTGQTRGKKIKFRPDHDVHVREVFPAKGKDGKPLDRAGGFRFSHTPKGKVVGRVGTGFSHAMSRDMLKNPGRYVGRTAKVEAETRFRSGALSKPSFREWHLDKGTYVEEG